MLINHVSGKHVHACSEFAVACVYPLRVKPLWNEVEHVSQVDGTSAEGLLSNNIHKFMKFGNIRLLLAPQEPLVQHHSGHDIRGHDIEVSLHSDGSVRLLSN